MADAEDVLALLVIVSEKRGAFGGKAISDLIPVKSMAALALAQHLHRAGRTRATDPAMPAAAAEFQDRIQQLHAHSEQLEAENQTKAQQLEALAQEIEQLDKNSTQYQQELERVKSALFALEEQAGAATGHLTDAYSELNSTQRQGRRAAAHRGLHEGRLPAARAGTRSGPRCPTRWSSGSASTSRSSAAA